MSRPARPRRSALYAPAANARAMAKAVQLACDAVIYDLEDAANAGKGELAVNGRMVERLHADMARKRLARAAPTPTRWSMGLSSLCNCWTMYPRSMRIPTKIPLGLERNDLGLNRNRVPKVSCL